MKGRKIQGKTTGYIFNTYVLLILLAVLLVAAWAKLTVVVVLLGLVLVTAGLTRLWSQLSLKSVITEQKISDDRVFPGETVELQLKVTNRKILPLPWIEIENEMPLAFHRQCRTTEQTLPGYGFLSKSTSLLWYSSATWHEKLTCNKRGYYKLGPLTASSGDIFGFYPSSMTNDATDHITVYPVIYPVSELGIPPLYPIGDTRAERRIFTDPNRVIGIREYTTQDSLRHVHWKSTARHQELHIKVFEPTTTLDAAIFLSVDSFRRYGSLNTDDLEFGISTAASIASYVITEQRSSIGLFVNTSLADSGAPVRILPGSGTKQLISILDALAKTTTIESETFADFLHNQRKNLPWGTSIILITGQPVTLLSQGLLENLKEAGYKTTVLLIGNHDENSEEYPELHKINNPGDLAGVTL